MSHHSSALSELEKLPNIGAAIATDLRAIGITQAQQIAQGDALKIYFSLAAQMGKRHDPCVLYTLLAVQHFLRTDEKLAWWKFTGEGKALLAKSARH
jgi:Pathogenicity locus